MLPPGSQSPSWGPTLSLLRSLSILCVPGRSPTPGPAHLLQHALRAATLPPSQVVGCLHCPGKTAHSSPASHTVGEDIVLEPILTLLVSMETLMG